MCNQEHWQQEDSYYQNHYWPFMGQDSTLPVKSDPLFQHRFGESHVELGAGDNSLIPKRKKGKGEKKGLLQLTVAFNDPHGLLKSWDVKFSQVGTGHKNRLNLTMGVSSFLQLLKTRGG